MEILHIYLLGFMLLLAFISKIITHRRSRHQKNIRKAKKIIKKIRSWDGENIHARIFSYLRKIDPFVFEELLLECFHEMGFKIKRNRRYTGDGGIDGTLFTQAGEKVLVQAKRYKNHINPQHITEFQRVIKNNGAAYGFFVHTGKTGKASYESLRNNQIHLVSGGKLIDLLIPVEEASLN